jgi:Tfp pilus assembly protein PilF
MNLKENDQLLALAEQYFQNNNYEPATAILKKIIETDLNNSKAN